MPPSFIVFLLVIGVVQGLDSCVVFPYLTSVLFTLTVSVDDTPGRCPFCRDHVFLFLLLSRGPAARAEFSVGADIIHHCVVCVIDAAVSALPLLSNNAYYRLTVGPVISLCCQFTELPLLRISKGCVYQGGVGDKNV